MTRPSHQAAHLCALLSAAGGIPVALPVLAIAEPNDLGPARALAAKLNEFDIVIFISVNAVERGMALIHQYGSLPPHLKLAAVGQRTAAALLHAGGRVDIQAPPPHNSEALLAAAELQDVKGKSIVIFRGGGGRELLVETLRSRGASVVYAEVYRRVKPGARSADMFAQAGEIDIVIITSQDGLRNLLEMADMEHRRDWLLNKQLAVISTRVAQLAAALGFKHRPLVAAEATDEALVAAIEAWRRP